MFADLKDTLSQHWFTVQKVLFPHLIEHLDKTARQALLFRRFLVLFLLGSAGVLARFLDARNLLEWAKRACRPWRCDTAAPTAMLAGSVSPTRD